MSCRCNVFEIAQKMRDQALGQQCSNDGNPFFRNLIIRIYDYGEQCFTYQQITPTPYIKLRPGSPEESVGSQSIQGQIDQYDASISRSYSRDFLENQVKDFIIDGDINELRNGNDSGVLCELESIEDKATYWEAILIEKKGEQRYSLI